MTASHVTLSDMICKALDRDYSLDRAAADLGTLMMERELIERKGDTFTPRLRELEQIIPLQERLALGKLRGDQVFTQLDLLGIRLEKA
jgi:hypothetical protein